MIRYFGLGHTAVIGNFNNLTLAVGDLLQRKLLSRVRITSGGAGEQLEEGHLITAQMVRRGWAESDVQTTPGDERATLPGDILVATVGQPAARVDREGGHRTGPGVEVLRLAEESNLSPQYVCQMLGGPWNERFVAGTLPRVRIQDLEIPVIPLSDQEEAATNVAVLTRMEELTQQLHDRVSTTRTAMLEAVREGVDLNTANEETS